MLQPARRSTSVARSYLGRAGLVVLGALACAVPVAAQDASLPEPRPALALMGTVPIFWGEAQGFADLLDASEAGHWARAVLERDYTLVAADYLSATALAPHRFLLLAQPRAFSAEENLALDAWVREGGKVLLFADPMMTGHSRFGLGDRRRPQDVALLSPILTHWGLDLVFDESAAPGLQWHDAGGWNLPVNLPGQLHLADAGTCGAEPAPGAVSPAASAILIARCSLGQGEALIVADGAILDAEGPHLHAEAGLAALLAAIFGSGGEIAGQISASGGTFAAGGAIPLGTSARAAVEGGHSPP